MWVNFTEEECQALQRVINGAHQHLVKREDIKTVIDRLNFYRSLEANDQRYRDAVETCDDLECDDEAVTSPNNDGGAWVMTWTYVRDSHIGLVEPEGDEA